MKDQDYILKLGRRYSKDETVKLLLQEIGKQKSYIQELEHTRKKLERKIKHLTRHQSAKHIFILSPGTYLAPNVRKPYKTPLFNLVPSELIPIRRLRGTQIQLLRQPHT